MLTCLFLVQNRPVLHNHFGKEKKTNYSSNRKIQVISEHELPKLVLINKNPKAAAIATLQIHNKIHTESGHLIK